jgi:PTH2 family peptidyl-tRNA hydrolase
MELPRFLQISFFICQAIRVWQTELWETSFLIAWNKPDCTMEKGPVFEWKQCLVIRSDLRMSCGKMCAQAAHASLLSAEKAAAATRKKWLAEGQKKVVLKAAGERDLFELKSIAEAAGIAAALVQDAGLTEIPPGTVTALGIGPAKAEDMDRITGSLSLL